MANARSLILVCWLLYFHLVPDARAEVSLDLGLGYGRMTHDYGDIHFDPQSVAGHVDVKLQWWALFAGVGYMTTTNLNIDDNRSYASMTALIAGFNLGHHLELVGGVGGGDWRRKRVNSLAPSLSYDYKGTGTGYMASARLYLFNKDYLSIGLSATYYHMNSNKYKSNFDGVETSTEEYSKGTGSIGALVFRFTGDYLGKRKKSK